MKIPAARVNGSNEDPEHGLYQAIAAIKSTEEAKKFLRDLCTPTELQAMADRWRVVALLKDEKPYRKIHEETGVSVTTIGRVARYISLGSGGYNIIYERLEKKKHDKPINLTKTKNRRSKKWTS